MGRLDGKIALIVGGGADGPPNAGETLSIGNGRATAILCAREGAAVMAADRSSGAGRRDRRGDSRRGRPRRCGRLRRQRGGRLPPRRRGRRARTSARSICWSTTSASRSAAAAQHHHRAVRQDVRRQPAQPFPDDAVRGARDRQGRRRRDRQRLLAGRDSPGSGIAYEATKAALLGLSRSVAVRHARDKIRVNTILPGLINSSMVRREIGDREAARRAAHPDGPSRHAVGNRQGDRFPAFRRRFVHHRHRVNRRWRLRAGEGSRANRSAIAIRDTDEDFSLLRPVPTRARSESSSITRASHAKWSNAATRSIASRICAARASAPKSRC